MHCTEECKSNKINAAFLLQEHNTLTTEKIQKRNGTNCKPVLQKGSSREKSLARKDFMKMRPPLGSKHR